MFCLVLLMLGASLLKDVDELLCDVWGPLTDMCATWYMTFLLRPASNYSYCVILFQLGNILYYVPYLFICGLVNDAVGSLENRPVASMNRMIDDELRRTWK